MVKPKWEIHAEFTRKSDQMNVCVPWEGSSQISHNQVDILKNKKAQGVSINGKRTFTLVQLFSGLR